MSDYHQLSSYVSQFPKVRVLCVGDIMVDRYVYGKVDRISAEGPIPVMAYESESVMLGAVGNVARNVVALGGQATVIAIVGDDDGGNEVVRLIAEEEKLGADLVTVPGRRTTLKTRYVARGQQLLRADREDTGPLNESAIDQLIQAYQDALSECDVVVFSDYAKGCLSDDLLKAGIEAAKRAGIPTIVDPKSKDFTRYNGVSVIKPNSKELSLATGMVTKGAAAAVAAAEKTLHETSIGAVLVTRSEEGMSLVERDQPAFHSQEKSTEVFDVSGAGDTALASLALSMGAGASLPEATQLANKTCNIVIGKMGTAVVYASELLDQLQHAEFDSVEAKIHPLEVIQDHVAKWKANGETIGFTNGCFDLIHAGHVSLLGQAKEQCDRLIVGLNTDASVKRLKGETRPINHETARAIVLASVGAVDGVVLFDEDTPLSLIETLRPDVLIKGADYKEEDVVGGDIVKSYGGRVYLAGLAPELSTTNTIKKINEG